MSPPRTFADLTKPEFTDTKHEAGEWLAGESQAVDTNTSNNAPARVQSFVRCSEHPHDPNGAIPKFKIELAPFIKQWQEYGRPDHLQMLEYEAWINEPDAFAPSHYSTPETRRGHLLRLLRTCQGESPWMDQSKWAKLCEYLETPEMIPLYSECNSPLFAWEMGIPKAAQISPGFRDV